MSDSSVLRRKNLQNSSFLLLAFSPDEAPIGLSAASC
jgi:hypothetical protein